jgi:hypothetical protein
VFDKFIAIVDHRRSDGWVVIQNNYLAPTKYVDVVAVGHPQFDRHIYAVTELRGDVLVWEPYECTVVELKFYLLLCC